MHGPRIVEFYEMRAGRSVLTEIEALLTNKQLAAFYKNIKRLEQHGWDLNGDYFSPVAGQKTKLVEYRLCIDKIELRLLFSEENGDTFLMLAAYKEKRNSIPKGKIDSAKLRLKLWRNTHK